MKPVKLIIEGVNSFTDAQTLDFEAVGRSDLFCICGKTGAGKTTIFDSILLALYGRSGRGNLADIVNLSRTSAHVSFTFTDGGDEYRIERTIKVKAEKKSTGGAQRALADKTKCELYKNGEIVANTADDVSSLVDRIIGLDMSEFKNVYLLEQGEYADFLKKTPAEQSKAVGKIFSLMRFGQVYKRAKEKMSVEDGAAKTAGEMIEKFGEISAERLRDEKSKLAVMRTKCTLQRKDIEEMRAAVDILSSKRDEYISAQEKEKAVRMASERVEAAKKSLDIAKAELDAFLAEESDGDIKKLASSREELNRLAELNALDREYAAAAEEKRIKQEGVSSREKDKAEKEASVRTLAGRADGLFGEFDAAAKAFASAVEKLNKPSQAAKNAAASINTGEREERINEVAPAIFALREEKTAFDSLKAEKDGIAEKQAALAKARDELLKKIEAYSIRQSELEEKLITAKAEEEKAAKALAEAQMCSHAAAVRAELREGDACPVCGGIYRGGGAAAGDVEGKKREREEAAARVKRVADELAEVQKFLDKAKADFDRADTDGEELSSRAREIDKKIEDSGVVPEVYAEMSQCMARAKKSGEGYSAAQGELMRAAVDGAAASAALEAAIAALGDISSKAERLAAGLGEHLGRTEGEIAKVKAEVAELERLTEAQIKRKNELTANEGGARSALDALKEALDEAVRACPADMPQFDEDDYLDKKRRLEDLLRGQTETEKEIAAKESEITALSADFEKLSSFEAERREHQRRAERYGIITEMTRGEAMLNYVATEYIEDFTAIASDILGELSAGKYSMSYDAADGFTVADFLNDGKSRKTKSLSGGEMFLASLSVAIAIARAVGGGNNAFFFLDEGFGTLDDELIDTVYSALESLSRDCLVGVISHADSLIDRIPSKVEVIEATDTVGSRIEY